MPGISQYQNVEHCVGKIVVGVELSDGQLLILAVFGVVVWAVASFLSEIPGEKR